MLEDLCGRAEVVSDDRGEAEWFSLPASDIRMLVNEIMSIRSKKTSTFGSCRYFCKTLTGSRSSDTPSRGFVC